MPLLISGPGLAQGQVCADLAAIEDIYPTILEAAGLPCPRPDERRPVPGQPAAPFCAGRSLLELARGRTPSDWREAVFIESFNNLDSRLPGNWVKTVRTVDARYSLYGEGAGEQLFDLAADPDEQENLAADPTHRRFRQQMRDLLLQHLLVERYPHPPRDLFRLGVH
ncbi:MAG: hypothetical protein F4Y46_03795 [Chloroflexi bacterium]|nr:hypothetical protein [Chloroflexota bacterium]